MLAVSVVFTSVVEFLSIAVYTTGVPVAVHDSLEPRNVCTTGPGDAIIFGETNNTTIKITLQHYKSEKTLNSV